MLVIISFMVHNLVFLSSLLDILYYLTLHLNTFRKIENPFYHLFSASAKRMSLYDISSLQMLLMAVNPDKGSTALMILRR